MATTIRKVKTTDLELKDRLVSIQRVTKVTKGGRTFSFSAIVVVGNEGGIVLQNKRCPSKKIITNLDKYKEDKSSRTEGSYDLRSEIRRFMEINYKVKI